MFLQRFLQKIKNILPEDSFLTHELVYANITIVMETDRKKITEENLIRCGREEFLEKRLRRGEPPGYLQTGRSYYRGFLFLF